MANTIKGKDILEVLTSFGAPATMNEIMRLFALQYPKMPLNELKKSVKRAITAGVRYGFLQNDDIFYYTSGDAEQLFLEDAERSNQNPYRNKAEEGTLYVSTKSAKRAKKPTTTKMDDIAQNVQNAFDLFQEIIDESDDEKPMARGKKKANNVGDDLSSGEDEDNDEEACDHAAGGRMRRRRRRRTTRSRGRTRSRRRRSGKSRSRSRKRSVSRRRRR